MNIEVTIGGRGAVQTEMGGVKYVAVPGTLQEKSVSPSESAQTVVPDEGKIGLSQVNVGAIPSDYVGSGVTRDPAMTTSGKKVTAPAGYYTEAQEKSVADGELADPSISVSAGGLITAQASVGTAGYLAAESSKSKTQQLSTQAGKTVTPSNVEQIAVEAGKYTTGAVKVAAISLPTLHIDTATATAANGSKLVFTGLDAEPEMFFVTIDPAYNDRRTTAVMYDGTTVYNVKQYRVYSAMTVSYSNGTLTITGGSTDFDATYTYTLTYGYVA